MEIDNAVFQGLEIFGKREVFETGKRGCGEVFGFLFGKLLRCPEIDIT